MNIDKTKIKTDLSKILIKSLTEGLEFLKSKEDEIEMKKKMFSFSSWDSYKFGTIKYFDSGIVNYDDFGGKFKYQSVINLKEDISLLPSWSEYHNYIRDSQFFKEYYDFSEFGNIPEESKEFALSLYTTLAIQDLLDSYIYLNKRELTVNTELLSKLINEYLHRIFIESVSYNIWIPIIFTKFNCDLFELSETISIRKIPDEFQIARNVYIDDFSKSRIYKLIIAGCTHAIVIESFESQNLTSNSLYNDFLNVVSSKEFRKKIDKLICSINISSSEQIFYHQFFAHSESCIIGRYVDIESVKTVYIEDELPDILTNYGWLRIPRLIEVVELEDAKMLFKSIESSNNLKLEFATRKLISSSLRKKSEDTLLDLTMGLESILSNDSKSEITYRLSLRGGFICKLFQMDDFTPSQVRDALKKIYDYRSAIVHGAKESEKSQKSIIKLNEQSFDCNYIALKILRHCLKFLIDNPKYLDLRRLEDEILNNEAKELH